MPETDPQKMEQAILDVATQFEKFLDLWTVAFTSVGSSAPQKWYTPKQMLLRALKATALASPSPELATAAACTHGAIACLGIRGTVKVILELRRKHGGNKKKSAVPGVRQRSGNNPR